jgi:hypothetical protein
MGVRDKKSRSPSGDLLSNPHVRYQTDATRRELCSMDSASPQPFIAEQAKGADADQHEAGGFGYALAALGEELVDQ